MPRHHGQKASRKEQEALQKQKQVIQEQQQARAFYDLRVREVQALESIAESLFVANEEKVEAWRTKIDRKVAEEQVPVQTVTATKLVHGEPMKGGPDMELPPPGDAPPVIGEYIVGTTHAEYCFDRGCKGDC